VELDDVLGGAAVQHRDVQEYESELFLSYFNHTFRILEGGVESGFHHVKPEEYKPRLLHLKGKKTVRVTQVDLTADSLNSSEVFVLDLGLEIYQFNGKHCGGMERNKGATITMALVDERHGAKHFVLDEGDGDKSQDKFWSVLGGRKPIKSGPEAVDQPAFEIKLLELHDVSGKISLEEKASGKNVKRSLLISKDVFILDTGVEVFVWIGKKASVGEKKVALQYAHDYLVNHKRPLQLPITRLYEGGESEVFEVAFQ